MKKKQIKDLKPGQKFRYKRKLYLLDDVCCPVHISSGRLTGLSQNKLVTPVKISIYIK